MVGVGLELEWLFVSFNEAVAIRAPFEFVDLWTPIMFSSPSNFLFGGPQSPSTRFRGLPKPFQLPIKVFERQPCLK